MRVEGSYIISSPLVSILCIFQVPLMTPAPSVRLAQASDAAQIASLVGRVWVNNFGWSVSADDIRHLQTETLSLAKITSEIEDPDISYIVATLPDASDTSSSDNDASSPITQGTTGKPETGQAGETSTIIGIIQLVSGTSEPCLTLPAPIELRRLYVEDGYHGMGIAQTLFKHAIEYSREKGKKSIWLGVWEQNARGQAFYKKRGFETVGEHSFVVGESVRRDWVMERAI